MMGNIRPAFLYTTECSDFHGPKKSQTKIVLDKAAAMCYVRETAAYHLPRICLASVWHIYGVSMAFLWRGGKSRPGKIGIIKPAGQNK